MAEIVVRFLQRSLAYHCHCHILVLLLLSIEIDRPARVRYYSKSLFDHVCHYQSMSTWSHFWPPTHSIMTTFNTQWEEMLSVVLQLVSHPHSPPSSRIVTQSSHSYSLHELTLRHPMNQYLELPPWATDWSISIPSSRVVTPRCCRLPLLLHHSYCYTTLHCSHNYVAKL